MEKSAFINKFEKIANDYSDKIALSYKKRFVTYKELNLKINGLANELRNLGVQSGNVIAVCVPKSLESIVYMLAIFKLGAIYLPIDIETPSFRFTYILNDANVSLVLGDIACGSETRNMYIAYDDISMVNENPDVDIDIYDIMYIIYTSGSSGVPKGVSICQKGVLNLCEWFIKQYDMNSKFNVLQLTNTAFDVSIEEILPTLLVGANLYLPTKKETISNRYFKKCVEENSINMIQVVPTTLRELLLNNERIDCLKIVICGGEQLGEHEKNELLRMNYRLFNHYGPTEATVDVLCNECVLNKEIILDTIVDNMQIHILDDSLKEISIGERGVLWLSGVGLSSGYVNDLEKTQASFKYIKDGIFAYNTGDVVEKVANNKVKFIGRKDSQIKIRGHRIQLEEIENFFLSYLDIYSCKIIITDIDHEKKIGVFFLANKNVSINEIRDAFLEQLPIYMLPTHIEQITAFPLLQNGKIDTLILKERMKNIYNE